MSGTARTFSYLTGTEFADGQPAGSITPSDMRDFIATALQQRNTVIYAGAPEYGVTCNGSTDDTAAWGLAFTAAVNAGGAVVMAPPGTSIVSFITIPSDVRLMGMVEGLGYYIGGSTPLTMGTIIKSATSQSSPIVTMDGSCSIYGINIWGPSTADQDGIYFGGGQCQVESCNIFNCNNGINCNYNGGLISGNRIGYCNNGIAVPTDCLITNNFINACTSSGLYLGPGSNSNSINNNIVEWCVNNNVYLWSDLTGGDGPVSDNTISCNRIDAAGQANIQLTGASHCSVVGNTLNRGGRTATFQSSNDCQVNLTNCGGCVVSGNTMIAGINDDGTGPFGPYYGVYGGGLNATLGGYNESRVMACTLNNTTTITIGVATTNGLTVGTSISGTGIQSGTTISTVTAPSTIIVSKAATTSGSESLTVTRAMSGGNCQVIGNDIAYGGARDNGDSTITFTNNIAHQDVSS